MDKFNGKYRIASTRLPNWDYSSNGVYFITICIKDRHHHFGTVENGKMKLSTIGAIVQGFWYDIPHHFDHVALGEFIVMPNHLHGILILDDTQLNIKTMTSSIEEENVMNNKPFFSKISPKAGSVSRILGSFKSVCTKHINIIAPELIFEWQERFWDSILSDEKHYVHVINYIKNNPKKWEDDCFFT